MSVWNRFTAWLSGWPESKAKKEREDIYLFEEEEMKKKPKGLKSKKSKKTGPLGGKG